MSFSEKANFNNNTFHSPTPHYPMIIATGNNSGQGNGGPASIFLL